MTVKISELNERLSMKHSHITHEGLNDTRINDQAFFKCSEHGVFKSTFTKVLSSKYGCPHCRKVDSELTRRKPHNHYLSILEKANIKNLDVVYTKPLTRNSVIRMLCETHGWFSITLASVEQGSGCRKCGYLNSSRKQRKYTTDRIMDACEKHGYFKYDYSLIAPVIQSNKVKVPIICDLHGIFYQRFNDHLAGKGCPKCVNQDFTHAYLHLVKDGGINVCLKYGITKNPDKRFSELQSGTFLKIVELGKWEFKSSEKCREVENFIKARVGKPKLTMNEMKDGFTETCDISFLKFITDTFNNKGGQQT